MCQEWLLALAFGPDKLHTESLYNSSEKYIYFISFADLKVKAKIP
jgi:hypothetical protein